MKWLEVDDTLKSQGLDLFSCNIQESNKADLVLLGVCVDLPHDADVMRIVEQKNLDAQWASRLLADPSQYNLYYLYVVPKRAAIWVFSKTNSVNSVEKRHAPRHWIQMPTIRDEANKAYCAPFFQKYWISWPRRPKWPSLGGPGCLFSSVGNTSFERRMRTSPERTFAAQKLQPGDQKKQIPAAVKSRLNALQIQRYNHLAQVNTVTDQRVFAQYAYRSSAIELSPICLKHRYRWNLGSTLAHEFAHHFDHLYFNQWAKNSGIRMRQSRRWRTSNRIQKFFTYGLSGRAKTQHSIREEFLAESGGLALRLLAAKFDRYEHSRLRARRYFIKHASLLRQVKRNLLPAAMAWLSCFKENRVRVPPAAQRRLHVESSVSPSRMVRLRPIKHLSVGKLLSSTDS